MQRYALIAAVALVASTFAVAPSGQAADAQSLQREARELAPAVNYDWDDLQEGDVVAVGVPTTNAHGETRCTIPNRISISVMLDPDAPVGTGKGLRIEPASGCQMVVAAKTLIVDGKPAKSAEPSRVPVSPSELVSASPQSHEDTMRFQSYEGMGPVNTCGPAQEEAMHSQIKQWLKGTSFTVTARLRYLYDDCTVTVTGTNGHCTYDPQRGVLKYCSAGTTVNANPVTHEIWGSYGEDASANTAQLYTAADGYVGGQGGCRWDAHNTWGDWPDERLCYSIDPSEV